MSGNGSVTVPPDSTGKIIDCTSLSVGGVVAMRQRVIIADPTSSAGFASVTSGRLNVNAGTTVVTGVSGTAVSVVINAGSALIGQVSVAGTVVVTGISGTSVAVNVANSIILAAGAAHVGEVSVVGAVTVSNSVNVNGGVAISGTASVVVGGFLDPSGQQRNVVDSANTALRVNVVAGGAGGGAVFGQVANGASLSTTNLPVLMGGTDSAGGGVARTILTDTTGRLIVGSVGGTVVVAGNVSATIIGTTTIQGNVSATVIGSLPVGTNTVGAVLIGSFIDASGSLKNVVDSAASAIRVSLVTASATLAVSFAATSAAVSINGTVTTTFTAANAAVSINGAVALAAGVAHIGEVNISVMPAIVLAAGAAHIGEVNISLMPAMVAGGSSVTVASVVVLAGFGSKLSAGASVSATTAWVDPFGRQVTVANHPSIVASATQGPQNKDITATAFTTLVVSAGANCVYVTGILVTNGSTTLTGVAFCSSDQTAAPQVVAYLAANGGGFTRDFNPPWKLSAGTALQARIFPTAALTVTSVLMFYVGPP